MNKDVLSFTQIKIDNDLITKIWQLDPKTLEHIDGAELSSYALALSQYLIYFTYQRNLTKAEQHRLSRHIDRTISLLMTEEDIKKFKTKAAATDYIVSTNMELMAAQTKLDAIQIELIQIEGMDKVFSELIATMKRELTRRENELYQIRAERK